MTILDRSLWEGCQYCASKFANYEIKPCANGDLGARAMYIVNGSGPGVILFVDKNIASGYFDISFCPSCGRPLTEAAWAELERRIHKCLN